MQVIVSGFNHNSLFFYRYEIILVLFIKKTVYTFKTELSLQKNVFNSKTIMIKIILIFFYKKCLIKVQIDDK